MEAIVLKTITRYTILCITLLFSTTALSESNYQKISDLAYGPSVPGNLLNLYLPQNTYRKKLPLIIWHSGSAWMSPATKDADNAVAIAEEFTARGFAVATISIRSSFDARFPAQGHDVRAAIRWLRTHAKEYGLHPRQFVFMGNSSGGWAAAFAATTSDIKKLPGEKNVKGVSSAVQVAVPFFPPTDFLSMDDFAKSNNLPMGFAYPHNATTSPESLLIKCPGEPDPIPGPPEKLAALNPNLLSIQDCPRQTEAADPSSYIRGKEIPIWVLHGLEDPLLPYNQSLFLYEETAFRGNLARFTLVPSADHSVNSIIDSKKASTRISHGWGFETVEEGAGPSWDDIESFIRSSFKKKHHSRWKHFFKAHHFSH